MLFKAVISRFAALRPSLLRKNVPLVLKSYTTDTSKSIVLPFDIQVPNSPTIPQGTSRMRVQELDREAKDELERRKLKLYEMAQKEFSLRNIPKIEEEVEYIMNHFPICMHVLNIVLKVYILLNDADSIRRVIERISQEGFRPNTITYNLLISYYRNMKRLEDAEALLQRMKAAGLRPNTSIYTTIIAGFAQRGNFSVAEKYFEEARGSSWVVPDLHFYNAMISCFLAAGKPQEARALANEMIENGHKPNHVTYKVFLSELLDCGKVSEAEELYDLHLANSPEMHCHDYGEMILKFFRANAPAKAHTIFEEAMGRFKRVSGPAYASVIKYLSLINDTKRIDELFPACFDSPGLFAATSHPFLRHYIKEYTANPAVEVGMKIVRIYSKCRELTLGMNLRLQQQCEDLMREYSCQQ